MRGSFRWKLIVSYLILALLLLGTLYGYLEYNLEDRLVSGIRGHMEDQARIAALMAAKEVRDLHRDAPSFTAELSRVMRARVTVVTRDGEVTGDSEVGAAQLPLLENHGNRPEIRQAMGGAIGSSVRYSATLHTDMLYVAAPLRKDGVLRLALPLSEVEKARQGLQQTLGIALALAVVASLVLSALLARITSRPLATMAAAARRIGHGDFSTRIPIRSGDELGQLAQVMNDMAVRIEYQLQRMSSENNRLDAILKGMGEGVMVTDATGVITLVNPALRALFGEESALEGRSLLEVSRHPDLCEACRKVSAEKREELQEIDLGTATLLVHWVPLVQEGQFVGMVAVFHDITDLKKLEKVRRDFVANVSHELRTPVTVIKGYAETLISGALADDPERHQRFLGIILSHAERLSTLIGDLLTLSELESGELTLKPVSVAVSGAVEHALNLLEQKAAEKGIVIEVEGVAGVPRVLADPVRLDQVVINLLDNAIKYTPQGGTVTVQAAAEGEMVRISVRDSGIGIPEKDLPRLFERFYRVDAARSRDQGGTGLGLSIVKHIVQAHGGTISVESAPGKGSVFSFTVKRA
ncbi:cell wall metabolism sensor histidine kinase WalK [Geomonas sp. RF6]|uniref:two-component system histidine kinase PnpS n=1 Tax=Geomonas sp. RF6 TaxID=2897342 RepID=UPI001E55B292|nr:ATP-binding protein [Geomonas sp. RF6]UFS71278.1 cell wall metabolism sensor histidine kinase WalK [Geomonas sp. RF6]